MALTYQTAGDKIARNEVYSAYITATGNDTTDPVNGKTVDNRDGAISALSAQVAVTASTGSSPTLNLVLQGSNDGTYWAALKDSGGNTIETGALSITNAATTHVVAFVESDLEGRTRFPAFLRLSVDLGGSTPGWTGKVALQVKRSA